MGENLKNNINEDDSNEDIYKNMTLKVLEVIRYTQIIKIAIYKILWK